MPRRHRLALALLLCGIAPLAHASAYRSVCPADPGRPPSGDLTATRVAAAKVDDDQDRLYEGAVWKEGALYLSDFVHTGTFPSRIRRFTPPDRWETVVEDSGSNGLALDTEGHLIAATHDRKQVARVDLADGTRTALVSSFEGAPFNSPNDLVMAADGTLYFTDPDYQRKAAPGGQPLTRVYRHHAGTTTVVDDTLRNPNGIALSPDGGTLYVAGGTDDGEAVYRACRTGDHHHHLVCRVCGRTLEIEGPAVERWTESVAAAHGFRDVTHTVEIFGTCPDH